MSLDVDRVVIRAFSHPHEAHLAASALAAAGIDCTIADQHIVAADWLYSNAVGGVKLVVRAVDADAATLILDTPAVVEDEEGSRSDANGTDEFPACPHCGSQNVERLWGRRLAVLSWMLVGFPLFPVSRRTKCRECGRVSAD